MLTAQQLGRPNVASASKLKADFNKGIKLNIGSRNVTGTQQMTNHFSSLQSVMIKHSLHYRVRNNVHTVSTLNHVTSYFQNFTAWLKPMQT